MQTMVSDHDHHSVGFLFGKLHHLFDGDSQYGFTTYNYHVHSFKSSGWVLGAGVGIYDDGSGTPLLVINLLILQEKRCLHLISVIHFKCTKSFK
jgi:hypothetical protein